MYTTDRVVQKNRVEVFSPFDLKKKLKNVLHGIFFNFEGGHLSKFLFSDPAIWGKTEFDLLCVQKELFGQNG